MGHLAAGLGFSPPAGLIKQTILESLSLYSYLGQTSSVLFFSNGWGKDSGVDLGRVMRSGTTDLSGAFLSFALGGSLA